MARIDQPHKLTFEQFIVKATDPKHDKHINLDYSKPETRAAFNGSKSVIPIWCSVHGKFFTQLTANHIALGQGCPECSALVKVDKRRKSNYLDDFNKAHGGRYDYSKVRYKNTHSKVEIVCREHGSFLQEPNAHMRGVGCPMCYENDRALAGQDKTEKYIATFTERANRVHEGRYTYPEKCAGSHSTVGIVCPTHGIFSQKAYSHLAGVGCPSCGKTTPYTQLEIAKFITSLGCTVEHDNPSVLGGKHIDIYIEDKKIGVEYNGSYWHTEQRKGNSHREKWELAGKAGVQLIQIFDFEWLERNEAVRNRLRAILGVSDTIYARKATVIKPTNSEAQQFYEKWHTQGGLGVSGVNYGLEYEGKLVACITISKGRFGSEDWEVRRYASIGRVVGGFSRLFKTFIKKHTPDNVASYCDLRWGTGKMYSTCGFILRSVTPPDYWWTNGSDKVSRYALQDRPSGITEKEYVARLGLSRVLGVGHQRWLWTK